MKADGLLISAEELPWRNPISGRVEMWRGDLGLAYPFPGPFVCRCLIVRTMFRFHIPLIEPDVRN